MRHFDFADEMPGSFEWYYIGDTHLGNSAYRRKPVAKCVAEVKSKKNSFFSLGGDLIDAITPTDKRFDIDIVDPKMVRITKQIAGAAGEFMPIAGKCKYVMLGNHEVMLSNILDGAEEIAKALGCEYKFPGTDKPAPANGTYTTISDLGCVRVFDWHGSGSCSSRAGDLHQREMNESIWVKRKMRDLASDCDVMIMHHIHKMRIHRPIERLLLTSTFSKNAEDDPLTSNYSIPTRIPILDKKGKKKIYYIQEEDRWYASSGSFLGGLVEGASPYTERFGYSPTDMGCVRLTVKNDKIVGVDKRSW